MTQQGMNVLNREALLVGGKPLNVLIFFDNSDRKTPEGFFKTFYGTATLGIMTLGITTLGITTLGITTLGITTLGITTLNIMTVSMMKVSIKGLYVALSTMTFSIKGFSA
jgi:hypothetical protein